jgi:hypothetical protein
MMSDTDLMIVTSIVTVGLVVVVVGTFLVGLVVIRRFRDRP